MDTSADRLDAAVAEHGGRVYSLGLRVTGSHHDAEEVFQEVFVKVWKAGRAFAELRNPGSWVYRVALNAALDLVDRRKRSPGTAARDLEQEAATRETRIPTPEAEAMQQELRDILRAMIDGLPRAQREAFVLRNDEGLSYREIGDVLDCPPERVRANFYQAMRSLRSRMKDRGFAPVGPHSE